MEKIPTIRERPARSADPAVRVATSPPPVQAVVVLPTLNEELGLDRTLSELPFDRFGDPGYRVQPIVIDGGSTDGTVEVARKWGVPVYRQTGRGKGAAVTEAVLWAREQGARHALVLDADATYPAQSIVPALSLLQEGSELVIGVRRPCGGPPRRLVDLVHRIGNIALSYTASLLSGYTIFDICSGFWGVSTDRFEELQVGSHAFAIEAELVLKALRGGLEVTQIPIEYRERVGEAKLHTFRDGGSILLSILRHGGRAVPARRNSPRPAVPAWELLSIGLIAESRTAVLEYPPSEFRRADRIVELLDRTLPEVKVRVLRVQSTPGSSEELALDPSAPGARPLRVTLPGPEAPRGGPPVEVSIEPRAKSLTIRLAPGPSPTPGDPSPPRTPWLEWFGRTVSTARTAAVLGSVTTRMNFDPRLQQQTLLRANGFQVQALRSSVGASGGHLP